MNYELEEKSAVKRFADFALDVGTFLLSSGAHCGRVSSNVRRMASAWGYDVDLEPSFTGLLVSVTSIDNPTDTVTSFRESPSYSVHLEVLTRVSALSWRVLDDDLTIDEAEEQFDEIRNMPNYNAWVVSLAVGLSCAGLCLFSFGDWLNALVACVAAFSGSLIRFKIAEMKFNAMISIAIASFVTTMITGLGNLYKVGSHPEAAMATAVLYLIPGVPLINCVIDLIEGYFSSAINRALFGGFILLCIAVGMTLSITLMGINNFN